MKKITRRPPRLKEYSHGNTTILTWPTPKFGWLLSYLFIFCLPSAYIFLYYIPWDSYVEIEYKYAQIIGIVMSIFGVWGVMGAIFNSYKCQITKNKLVRITRPFQLFNRRMGITKSHITQLYVDYRDTNTHREFIVIMVTSKNKSYDLFVCDTPEHAAYLQVKIECILGISEF